MPLAQGVTRCRVWINTPTIPRYERVTESVCVSVLVLGDVTVHLSVYLSVYLSVCVYLRASVRVSVCACACVHQILSIKFYMSAISGGILRDGRRKYEIQTVRPQVKGRGGEVNVTSVDEEGGRNAGGRVTIMHLWCFGRPLWRRNYTCGEWYIATRKGAHTYIKTNIYMFIYIDMNTDTSQHG